MSSYEAWRISYQNSEQAARAAFCEAEKLRARIEHLESKLKGAVDQSKLFAFMESDREDNDETYGNSHPYTLSADQVYDLLVEEINSHRLDVDYED